MPITVVHVANLIYELAMNSCLVMTKRRRANSEEIVEELNGSKYLTDVRWSKYWNEYHENN